MMPEIPLHRLTVGAGAFLEENQQKRMSSESKSHNPVRLRVEMHLPSAFEGELLVTHSCP